MTTISDTFKLALSAGDKGALGMFLRLRRVMLKCTQREMAERVGRSKAWAADVERAKLSPKRADVEAVCMAMGLDVQEGLALWVMSRQPDLFPSPSALLSALRGGGVEPEQARLVREHWREGGEIVVSVMPESGQP